MPFEKSPDEYLQQHHSDIPRIKNPERWWSAGNLAQLVCLRRTITTFEASSEQIDLLKMAILGILIPVSNAKHNHVSLTFAPEPLPTVCVSEVLELQLSRMLADLQAVLRLPRADVHIYSGNSKNLSNLLPEQEKISAVITSPPYPNRFSYARETRPHMFFFDFIESAAAVGQLETDAIGGTWGKATSVLSKGVQAKNDILENLLEPHLRSIHSDGDLMAHYVIKYFNDIYDHAREIAKVCRNQCRLAYVIGNSKFYGNPLPSDEILGKIFEHFGFGLEKIDRMRKRQSKSGLYEAVVFMQRG